MTKYVNHILAERSINVVVSENGVSRVISVPKESPMFQTLVDALRENRRDEVPRLADIAATIREHKSGRFQVADGVVVLDQEPLPEALSKRIIQFAEQNLDFQPLINFWNNLKLNPSKDSVQDLYAFLEHNNIPITKDGCFIAYKRVRSDYKDIHTGKIDNSVGQIVKMDRNLVDQNRNNTCSSGLHAASHKFANEFYGNGVLLEVKINPRDVVAVPPDYNQEKMRVCEYYVVRECAGPREEALYPDDDSYDDYVADPWDYSDDDFDDDDFDYEDDGRDY